MDDETRPAPHELREYLFDMLSQLAKIATACKEPGVALVLHTMVASRSMIFDAKGLSNGKSGIECSPDE